MKFLKIFFVLAIASIVTISCKNEAKKDETTKTEEVAAKVEEASFAISGMTCEIGCAKKIASDLSKKDGVLAAKVVFADSIATVKFDANKTNKADLMAFVDGIAENMYKTSDAAKKACKKVCSAKTAAEKEACAKKKACSKSDKKNCETQCKKKCSTKNEADKKACMENCKKGCCAETKKA